LKIFSKPDLEVSKNLDKPVLRKGGIGEAE
jgi:hypothetical protein